MAGSAVCAVEMWGWGVEIVKKEEVANVTVGRLACFCLQQAVAAHTHSLLPAQLPHLAQDDDEGMQAALKEALAALALASS